MRTVPVKVFHRRSRRTRPRCKAEGMSQEPAAILSRSEAALERHLTRGLALLLFLVSLLGIYDRGTKTGSLQRRDERSRVPFFSSPASNEVSSSSV